MKAQKDELDLFTAVADYDQWADILRLLRFAKELSTYPIHMVIAKHLMDCGVDTEEKLLQLLKTTTISQPIKVHLQNSISDVTRGVGGKNIPSLPKITIK